MHIPVDKHMCKIVALDILKNEDSDFTSFSENYVMIDCHITAMSYFERA